MDFVVPGERIATEEEFSPGINTYSENGIIYATLAGSVVKEEGIIGVAPAGREIKIIDREMLISGVVTDDLKSVMFVKIDNISAGNKNYIAIKDGKIVIPKPRPGGSRFGGRTEGARENRFSSRTELSEKPCGAGDAILARVQFNDKDSYQLSFYGPETGVIYSRCPECGADMEPKDRNMLVCKECGRIARKKISTLYNKPEEIKKLFA